MEDKEIRTSEKFINYDFDVLYPQKTVWHELTFYEHPM